MIRIVGVVVFFIVLNLGGFVLYRSKRPASAAPAGPAMPLIVVPTFARPESPSQPKSEAKLPEPLKENQINPPSQEVTNSTVTTVTTSPQRRRPAPVRPHVATPPPASPTESHEEKSVSKPTSNSVLDMEGNPYKRGE